MYLGYSSTSSLTSMSEDMNRISGNGMEETPLNCLEGLRCTSSLHNNYQQDNSNKDDNDIKNQEYSDINRMQQVHLEHQQPVNGSIQDNVYIERKTNQTRSSFEKALHNSNQTCYKTIINNQIDEKRTSYEKAIDETHKSTNVTVYDYEEEQCMVTNSQITSYNECALTTEKSTSKHSMNTITSSQIPLPDNNLATKSKKYKHLLDNDNPGITEEPSLTKSKTSLSQDSVGEAKIVNVAGSISSNNIKENNIEEKLFSNESLNVDAPPINKPFKSTCDIIEPEHSTSSNCNQISVNENSQITIVQDTTLDTQKEYSCKLTKKKVPTVNTTKKIDIAPRQTKLSIIRKAIATSNAAVFDNIRPETEKNKCKRLDKLKKNMSTCTPVSENNTSTGMNRKDKKNISANSKLKTPRRTVTNNRKLSMKRDEIKETKLVNNNTYAIKNTPSRVTVNVDTVDSKTENKHVSDVDNDLSVKEITHHDKVTEKSARIDVTDKEVTDIDCKDSEIGLENKEEEKDSTLDEEDVWVQCYLNNGNYTIPEIEHLQLVSDAKLSCAASEIVSTSTKAKKFANHDTNSGINNAPLNRHVANEFRQRSSTPKMSNLTKYTFRGSREYIETSRYLPKDYITSSIEYESDSRQTSTPSFNIPFSKGTPKFNNKQAHVSRRKEYLAMGDGKEQIGKREATREKDGVAPACRQSTNNAGGDDGGDYKTKEETIKMLPTYEEAVKNRKTLFPANLPPNYNSTPQSRRYANHQKTQQVLNGRRNITSRSIGIQVMLIGKTLKEEKSEQLMKISRDINERIQKNKLPLRNIIV